MQFEGAVAEARAPRADRLGRARFLLIGPVGRPRNNFFARGTKIRRRRLPAAKIVTLNMRLEGEKQWEWDVAHCFGCWAYRCQL